MCTVHCIYTRIYTNVHRYRCGDNSTQHTHTHTHKHILHYIAVVSFYAYQIVDDITCLYTRYLRRAYICMYVRSTYLPRLYLYIRLHVYSLPPRWTRHYMRPDDSPFLLLHFGERTVCCMMVPDVALAGSYRGMHAE